MPVRRAVFAEEGWYPASRAALVRILEEFVPRRNDAVPAIALVAPHAGYQFSGPVAGQAYARVVVPDEVIILSVNHRTPHAPEFALYDEGAWHTPLGDVPIATDLVAAITAEATMVEVDCRVHYNEHSGELQVPFLQHRNLRVRIAPVCISSNRAAMVREFAAALARAADRLGRPVLLVASSDFSHEQPTGARYGQRLIDYVREQDRKVIERILALDEPGLWRTIATEHVTMCGYAPVAAAITYAKARGATCAELVAQATSADATGHADYVVGYAGIIIR